MFKAQYKTDDTRHKNKKKKEEQQREQQEQGTKEKKRNETDQSQNAVLPVMPPTSLKKFMWGNV